VIAKRLDSRYEPGERSGSWVKVRVGHAGAFVIGGFMPTGRNFGALIVGSYEGDKLMFAAKVRAGFVPATRRSVFERLKLLVIKTCPFANLPDERKGRWGEGLTAEDMAECVWIEPKSTAALEYAELTPARRLKAPKIGESEVTGGSEVLSPQNPCRTTLLSCLKDSHGSSDPAPPKSDVYGRVKRFRELQELGSGNSTRKI
jgi:bifunctional non-homologous end joining protein LigD